MKQVQHVHTKIWNKASKSKSTTLKIPKQKEAMGLDQVRSGQVSLHAQMAALCWGTTNFETLPARNEGYERWFETMPGFSQRFLLITELFPAGESTYLLIHIVCCWVASGPNSVATIFAEATFWCMQQISNT